MNDRNIPPEAMDLDPPGDTVDVAERAEFVTTHRSLQRENGEAIYQYEVVDGTKPDNFFEFAVDLRIEGMTPQGLPLPPYTERVGYNAPSIRAAFEMRAQVGIDNLPQVRLNAIAALKRKVEEARKPRIQVPGHGYDAGTAQRHNGQPWPNDWQRRRRL